MHEYSLVSAMAERALQEARARGALAVHKLAVRIGSLSGVEPELFASAFTLVREGLLAGAALEIRRCEASWECPRCRATIPTGAVLRCPVCDEPARLVGGDEILLEQIEMEVP